jgi:hypothetical protein
MHSVGIEGNQARSEYRAECVTEHWLPGCNIKEVRCYLKWLAALVPVLYHPMAHHCLGRTFTVMSGKELQLAVSVG